MKTFNIARPQVSRFINNFNYFTVVQNANNAVTNINHTNRKVTFKAFGN